MTDASSGQRTLFRGLGEDALIKVGNAVADACDAQGGSYDDEPFRTIIRAVADELAYAYPLGGAPLLLMAGRDAEVREQGESGGGG